LRGLQAALGDDRPDADDLRARLESNFAWLERFAAAWRNAAVESAGQEIGRLVPVGEVAPVDLGPLRIVPSRAL
jgi:hypothetical protein